MKKIRLCILFVILALCAAIPFIVVSADEVAETSIVGHNLALEDRVEIVYIVDETAPQGAETGVLFWLSPQDEYIYGEQEYKITAPFGTVVNPKTGNTCQKYAFNYLSAKQMTEDVYAVSFIKDGESITYSGVDKYSILQYAYNKKNSETILDGGTASLGEMLQAMLEYGAVSQQYFGYNTERLANATYYRVTVDGGILPDGLNYGLYKDGDTVTVTANEPAEDKVFQMWVDGENNILGTESTLTYNLDKDITITANWTNKVHIHDYSETVFLPSCTEKGYTVHTCNGCDESYIDNYVDELGHSYGAYVQTTAPTCTDTGIETATCSRCGDTITRDISATGHTAAAAVEENRIEPTCTANGSYDSVVYCSVCNAEISRTSNQITMLGHSYGAYVQTTAPTCTSTGVETATCSRCGDTTTRDISATGHMAAAAVEENRIEPTCTTNGSYDSVVYCSVCNAEISRTSNQITMLGHSYGAYVQTTAPTCANTGVETATCSRCGDTTTRDISATGEHNYVDGVCTVCGDSYFTFTLLNDDTYEIKKNGSKTLPSSLIIPSTYNSKAVTRIGDYAFNNRSNLTSITIPDSVTSIGEYAFFSCSNLTSATIGNGVTSIGGYAFQYCNNLTSVTIGNSVTSIGHVAFSNCNHLSSIYYTGTASQWAQIDNVGNIMYTGITLYINNEPLTDAVLENITEIEPGAFYGCSSLEVVTISDSVTSIGDSAFQYCNNLEVVTIGNGVVSIGYSAFSGAYNVPMSLTTLTIGNSVTSIGMCAFSYCSSLTDVYYTGTASQWAQIDGLDEINNNDYSSNIVLYINNEPLTNAVLENITAIKPYAFSRCSSLEAVTISNSVTSIGNCAFYGCSNLTSLTIGNGVTSIGQWAFKDCSALESITIPFVGETLNGTANTHFGYIFGATGHGSHTSYVPTSLQTVIITGGNIIGVNAFWGCNHLTSITLPDSVTSIGNSAFQYCNHLTSVIIGNSVTSIGNSAFSNCSSLTSIYYKGTAEDWNSISMGTNNNYLTNATRYYYNENLDLNYEENRSWHYVDGTPTVWEITPEEYFTFTLLDNDTYEIKAKDTNNLPANIIIQPKYNNKAVTSIGKNAFSYCNDIESIFIPCTVVTFEDYAFYACDSLTSITIPDSIEHIGESVFNYCDALTFNEFHEYKYLGNDNNAYLVLVQAKNNGWYSIKQTTKIICERAFYGCNNMTSLIVRDNVSSIGTLAFFNCSKLATITLGSNVKEIGEQIFGGCSSLTSITVDENNEYYKSIDGNLYSKDGTTLIQYAIGKTATEFAIPNSVTSIGNSAFYSCRKLTSITIPNNVTSIGDYAFFYCTITSISIPDSVTSIGDYAFAGYSYNYGNSSLTSITFGENSHLTSIGNYAFQNCNLTSITIPDGITSIENGAFTTCRNLTSITIPNSVANIREDAFYNCSSLTSITFNGTTAQWNAINKDSHWKSYVPAKVVHCTDGDVAI